MKWANVLLTRRSRALKQTSIAEATTATLSTDQGCFAHLPIEILTLVVTQLSPWTDRNELKACRLVNHLFCELATPLLFHNIHFSKNLLSFNRLKHVAESPGVAQYVRQLVLHRGSWFERKGARVHHMDPTSDAKVMINNGLLFVHGEKIVSGASKAMLKAYRKNAMIEVQAELNLPGNWIENLRGLLASARFSHLEKIYCPSMASDLLSEYQVRRVGQKQILEERGEFDLGMIIRLCGQIANLKALHLERMVFDDMITILDSLSTVSWPSKFKQLERLQLSCKSRHLKYHVDAIEISQVLTEFFRTFNHVLKEVSVQFADSIDPPDLPDGSVDLDRMGMNIFSGYGMCRVLHNRSTQAFISDFQYPNLHHLTLSDFMIDEETFLSFLSLNSRTLKTLSLRNWLMPVKPTREAPIKVSHSSFTNVFWKIAQLTDLNEAHLDGIFRTTAGAGHNYWDQYEVLLLDLPCYTQAFRQQSRTNSSNPEAEAEAELNDLLTNLESYLIHRTPTFPFPTSVLTHLETAANNTNSTSLETSFTSMGESNPPFWLRGNDRSNWVWTLDAHPDVVRCSDVSWRFIDIDRETGARRVVDPGEVDGVGGGERAAVAVATAV